MAFRPVSRLVVASRSYWRLASRLVSRPVLAFRSCFVDWRLVSAFRLSCRRFVCRVGVGVSSLVLCRRSASRLVSAFCVVGRFVSVLSCCAVFVSSCSRVVSSFLAAAVVLCVLFSSCVSDGVGPLWRCGGAVRGCRGAGDMGVAWRYAMRGGVASGGSVIPCRAAWCAVSGTCGGTYGETRGRDEGRDVWRDDGRDDIRAVFVSSI